MNAREEILARLRVALSDASPPREVPRDYRRSTDRADVVAEAADQAGLVALFADRLTDYRATVHHETPDTLASKLGEILRDVERLVVPADVPEAWLAGYAGEVLRDSPDASLDNATLDAAGAVLTGCAVAIAETGTFVLDGGTAQGRRAITLVPDHHVCVLPADRIAAGVPPALQRLDPTRPLTFVSGPSATSDIELRRVEGVHGPRRLDVVIVSQLPVGESSQLPAGESSRPPAGES